MSQPEYSRRPDRQNEYFIPGEEISREVIYADITHYLGNDAVVRTGNHNGRPGFFIRAYRNLTSEMITDIKIDSVRWEADASRRADLGYPRGSYIQHMSQSQTGTYRNSYSQPPHPNDDGDDVASSLDLKSTAHRESYRDPYSQTPYAKGTEDDIATSLSLKPEASQPVTKALEHQPQLIHIVWVKRSTRDQVKNHQDYVTNITPAHIGQSAVSGVLDTRQQHTPANEISHAVTICLKSLSNVISDKITTLSEGQPDVPLALWQDELGRSRVWAANIGAHQTGQSSLDHRLRDASDVKKQVLQLLKRLQRLIQDLKDAVDSSDVDIEEEFSESEEDEEHQSEVHSIYYALRDTISDLFHMSVVIRLPAQRDRFLGTKRSDAVFYEPFDKQHVKNKYPDADENILNRLGLAISRRRALMRYRERHHIKLGRGLNTLLGDDTQSAKLSETVATEFADLSIETTDNWESKSQSAISQTSYAQTILHGDGIALPPRPKESADGNFFECPFCFEITSVKSETAWARHVFSDLMPYVCTFPGCSTPHRLYESRREWHFHLKNQHSIAEDPDNPAECPLCLASIPSAKQFERHVGRHLQELALFALPRFDTEDVDSITSDQSQRLVPEDMSDEENESDDGISGILDPDDDHLVKATAYRKDAFAEAMLHTEAMHDQRIRNHAESLETSEGKANSVNEDEGIDDEHEQVLYQSLLSNQTNLPVTNMASLWYCSGCNFGPHNSSLYNACIQCGATRSMFAHSELIKESPADITLTQNKVSFPFESCLNWENMEKLILESFQHMETLGPHVARGDYDLFTPNGGLILPHLWTMIAKPGWTIEIRIRNSRVQQDTPVRARLKRLLNKRNIK